MNDPPVSTNEETGKDAIGEKVPHRGRIPLRIGMVIVFLVVMIRLVITFDRMRFLDELFEDWWEERNILHFIIFDLLFYFFYIISPIMISLGIFLSSRNGVLSKIGKCSLPMLVLLPCSFVMVTRVGIYIPQLNPLTKLVFAFIPSVVYLYLLMCIEWSLPHGVHSPRAFKIIVNAILFFALTYISMPFTYDMEWSEIIRMPILFILVSVLSVDILLSQWGALYASKEMEQKGEYSDRITANTLKTVYYLLAACIVFMILLYPIYDSGMSEIALISVIVGISSVSLIVVFSIKLLASTLLRNVKFLKPRKWTQGGRIKTFLLDIREEALSQKSVDKWSRILIGMSLVMMGIGILPEVLWSSHYFSSWRINTEYFLMSSFLVLGSIFLPYQLHLSFRGRFRRHQVLLTIGILLYYLILIAVDVIDMDLYDGWIYLENEYIWLVLVPIPLMSSLLYPVHEKFMTRTRISTLIISSAICSTAVLFYIDIVHHQLIRESFLHLIYLIPLMVAVLLVGYTGSHWWRKVSFGDILKTILKSGLVHFIVIFLVLFGLSIGDSYRTWHNYHYSESFPEGVEGDIALKVLGSDLEVLTGSALYEGHLLDPNIVTLEVISDIRDWVKDAEKTKKWGSYYAHVVVSVSYDVNITIEHEIDEKYGSHDLLVRVGEEELFKGSTGRYHSPIIYLKDVDGEDMINVTGHYGSLNESNFRIEMEGIDIVYAEMSFGSQVGPLAGYGGWLVQYVGLKEDEIVFIYSFRSNWVS